MNEEEKSEGDGDSGGSNTFLNRVKRMITNERGKRKYSESGVKGKEVEVLVRNEWEKN